jgi:hypothetical protein
VTRRAVVLVLTAAAGLTVAAACDGDDGGGGGGSAPQVAEADAPFCDAYGALLSGPLADAATDAADPAVLRSAVAVTEALVTDLVAAAPAALAEAASELAADYDATFVVLERYGFDLARLDAEATAEEQAVLDAFGQTTAGSGADDPFVVLQRFVADRCAPEVTLPPELLETEPLETTTTSP